ncbi:MAG: hypothetical protein WDZ76_07070 [Pseudohongiellaceae bacterium]
MMRLSAILSVVFWATAVAGVLFAAEIDVPDYSRYAFQLPVATEQLVVADADGDDLQDLLTIESNVLRVYFQSVDGFDFETYSTLELPGAAVGWDISRLHPDDAGLTIIALVDGTRVMAWPISHGVIGEAQTLLAGLSGFISKGINQVRIGRDINGDSITDLVVPGAGVLQLHVRNEDGSFQPPIDVQSEVSMRTALQPTQLERETGQFIRIPQVELRDVNADGFNDLISSTEEKLDVFLASGNNPRYFNPVPSYTLDIAAIEAELGEFDIDRLDFSNLTGLLSLTHEEILEDIDGDGIDDLLLRQGGKVSLFGGTPDGMNLEQPRQVLRSAGNVLSTFLFDENGDGLKDLWLWRVESISLGDVFLWLALSGSIDVEAFVYPNEGESFARRPNRRLNITLSFPSALRAASTVMGLVEDARASTDDAFVPTSAARLVPSSSNLDLVALVENRLDIFLDAITPEPESDDFLSALGYSRERDNYEINLREILNNAVVAANPYLEQVSDAGVDVQIVLDRPVENGDLFAVELNNDNRDDLVVFLGRNEAYIEGLLLISN